MSNSMGRCLVSFASYADHNHTALSLFVGFALQFCGFFQADDADRGHFGFHYGRARCYPRGEPKRQKAG